MTTFITKSDAVIALTGKKGFTIKEDGTVEFIKTTYSKVDNSPITHDIPDSVPTKEEVTAKYEEMLAAIQYKIDRESEYPSLENVTVALAEKAEGDSSMWDEITAKRQAIKTKYPKE